MNGYLASVVTATDYEPFGLALEGRSLRGEGYRYGFNGQERDDDASKNSYTAEFWQYSPATGRRWNVDPVVKEYESPYLAFAGNPIWFSDPNGQDTLRMYLQLQYIDGYEKLREKVKLYKVTFTHIKKGVETIIGGTTYLGQPAAEVEGEDNIGNLEAQEKKQKGFFSPEYATMSQHEDWEAIQFNGAIFIHQGTSVTTAWTVGCLIAMDQYTMVLNGQDFDGKDIWEIQARATNEADQRDSEKRLEASHRGLAIIREVYKLVLQSSKETGMKFDFQATTLNPSPSPPLPQRPAIDHGGRLDIKQDNTGRIKLPKKDNYVNEENSPSGG